MFPIRDNNPTSSTAYVTIILITVNSLVFLSEAWGPIDQSRFTWKYGFVPAELTEPSDVFNRSIREHPPLTPARDARGRPLGDPRTRQPLWVRDVEAIESATAIPAWVNIFTCMFLHGGWWHLIGNMLFLWIFGNNIEDRLGPWLFIVFYVGTGVCGNLAHTLFDTGLGFTPLVGASGAISGVMGAYILLFPRARILAVVPIGLYPATFSLPAWIYLIFYIGIQNVYPAAFTYGKDNVAYWAHIGGFAAGMAMIFVFPHIHRPRPPAPVHDPREDDADFVL